MNMHKKIGGIPTWGWGVAIVGGLVLGIYLRRRAKHATSTPTTAQLTTAAGGGDTSLPTPGLDSAGVLSGLFQQQSDLLAALLASLGGGGNVPATPSDGSASTPAVSVASSGGSGASPSPNPAAPGPTDPTFAAPTTTYDLAASGTPVGTTTGPALPIGTPASTLYQSVGLQPSDPVTLLPAGSFSTSTGPNAQLSTQAERIPQPGEAVPV